MSRRRPTGVELESSERRAILVVSQIRALDWSGDVEGVIETFARYPILSATSTTEVQRHRSAVTFGPTDKRRRRRE